MEIDPAAAERVEQRMVELLSNPPALGRIAERVWAKERAAHCDRLDSIVEDGYFRIRDEAEMFEMLELLTTAAREEMQAVDHIDLAEWEADLNLVMYLEGQFKQVRSKRLSLTRIRLVDDEDLEDTSCRKLLARFVDRHDRADATLLLCPADAVMYLKTSFTQRTGLFMIDPRGEPAAVVGWGGGGPRDETELHVRETVRVRAARREFERLRVHALERGDEELRRQIGLRSRAATVRPSPSGAARTRT